jgi:hypothetical protein
MVIALDSRLLRKAPIRGGWGACFCRKESAGHRSDHTAVFGMQGLADELVPQQRAVMLRVAAP